MRMMAKAACGHRPIMLFRSLFRVVGKVRAGAVKRWMAKITADFPEINMAPRRWVSDATFRLQVRRDIEVGAEGGHHQELVRMGARSNGISAKPLTESAGVSSSNWRRSGATRWKHSGSAWCPTAGSADW